MKITKYLVSMAAALGMIAGCYKPEMVQVVAPEDVIAPVLEAIEGPIEITSENMANGSVEFKWSLADYGVKTEVSYAIEASNNSGKVTLASGIIADTTALNANELSAEVGYEDLNQILFNDLKLADGIAEEVTFVVKATVGELPAVYSNQVKVSCKVTAAEKVYPKLTVAGSYAYNNWTPGKGQFVFDFDGNDAKYSGVIDFGEDVSALQFKFVGEAWGNNEYSVPAGEAQAPEAAELPLVAGGGDNISAYTTHRFVSLTLDKATPKVIKNFSFNSLGVIGDGTPTGWDADTDMSFNADKQRFYVDLTLVDGTIKFRANDAWDVNWGGANGLLVSGGDNIAVAAGNYRIYVNLNDPANPTYELNAGMYGKDEPTSGTTTPEPEPEVPAAKGWGLVGEYNSWGGSPDVMLVSDGTYLVAKGVELSGQVKFRKDADWATNFGAPGEDEPVEITVNTELELVANGKNFTIAEGTYDVYLDEANAKAWFINDGSYPGGGAAPVVSEWGLIGSLAACNNWANNVKLYVSGDYSVAKGVEFAAGDQFKFRKGEAWGVELTYEGAITIDAKLDLIDGTGGKQNSSISEAGTYDVYLANDLSAYYVMTPGKTPADAGQAEVVIIDYTNCQMELVGSGVAAQDGATADLVWTWGNVLLASNGGKPVKAGDVYTWTWNNVVLTADGWKVRVLNAAESGGVANFDLGDGSVDKTASPNAQASTDGNIYVTAGTYNITLVIDAATNTKTVTVVAAAPADPWATATSYDLPEGASSSRQVLRNIKFYADDNNINIRLVASVSKIAEKPTDGLTISFYDKTNGTAGEGFYEWWNKAIGDVEYNAERCGVIDGANLTMTVAGNPVDVQKAEDGDLVTWTFAFPRSANAVLENAKVYMGILTLDAAWNATGAMPDKYADMFEVTLP